MILEFYNLFTNKDRPSPLERYLGNAKWDEISEIIINSSEKSLIFQYLSFFSLENNPKNVKLDYNKSFYKKVGKSNFYGKNQLKEFLDNFSQEKWNQFIKKNEKFDLKEKDYEEVQIINEFIEKIFFNNTILFSNNSIHPANKMGYKYDIFNDFDYLIDNGYIKYFFGTDLYAKVLFESLATTYYYPEENNVSNYDNYKYNPFMWMTEMIFFSGNNNFLDDSQILATFSLPLENFRPFILNENGEMVNVERPFNVFLNYLVAFIFGLSLITVSFYGFNKNIYNKAGEE